MLIDIDKEMQARGVDGIIVLGDTTLGNPDLTYVVGGSLARGGIYFKRIGNDPLLVTSNLDVTTARKYRIVKQIKTFTEFGYEKLTTKHGRDNAYPRLIKMILDELGIRGEVALFGRSDLAGGIYLADQLRKMDVTIIGEKSPTILESARETKTSNERSLIRDIGLKTSRIVDGTIDLLRNLRNKRGHLYSGKRRATVGLVKEWISIALAKEGLIAPEGTIFAPGVASADPHNAGNALQELKPGKPIVFDIFPQSERGYWFDLTRTFVLGKADPKTIKLFETVKEAQAAALDSMRDSVPCNQVMMNACKVIELKGYRTLRELYRGETSNVTSGFIHSLGHGVGLTIGERPYLSLLSTERLTNNQIVTVEPGIYLPGFGGVRIEDTVAITRNGVDILDTVHQDELEVS